MDTLVTNIAASYVVNFHFRMLELQPIRNINISMDKEVKFKSLFFAMAQIRRIGHDHQAPFWHLVVLVEVSSGDAKRKQAAKCTIHLRPPIFYRFRTPYKMTISGGD